MNGLSDAVVIKRDNLFLLSPPDGRLPADGPHPFGLWFRDCRFLSAHELRLAGTRPRRLASSDARGTEAVHELGHPGLSLSVRLVRQADPGGVLRERIPVRSHHRAPLRLPLALRLRGLRADARAARTCAPPQPPRVRLGRRITQPASRADPGLGTPR